MTGFLGFDHLDVRVRSLAAAQPFYDAFMSLVGLSDRRFVSVDGDDWTYLDSNDGSYNAVEYYEPPQTGRPLHFMGVIEDSSVPETPTRIAFRLPPGTDLDAFARRLRDIGACNVEPAEDLQAYPAIFFEDPCGTKLEVCARRPR